MWIYEHKNWPNFTWENTILSPMLADIRYRQGQLLGRMKTLGFPLKKEASLTMLTNDTVTSSAIEGDILDLKEVRSSIARRLGIPIAGLVPASRHVEGVVEMMLDATQKFATPLSKKRLFGWHAALFPTGHSGMHLITVGNWRTIHSGPMQVVSGPIGHEICHFEAPSADRLEKEMLAFLAWFNKKDTVDPVLKAGIAHFWFVTIHPFEDGNGRLARAIGDMALARADGTHERFYSLSSQIKAQRKDYYNQLEQQQRGSLDITDWLQWFLSCLKQAISSAEITLGNILFKAELWNNINQGQKSINDRQRLIINRLLEGDFKGYINTSKYAKLAKCSNDTALRDIQDLKGSGILIQNPSGGRSTSYRLIKKKELPNFD